MSIRKDAKAPLDILNMNPEAYREIGETLQQHACFRILSHAMSCVRSEEQETAIISTIEGYNDFMAAEEEAEAAADAFDKMGIEPDLDRIESLSRQDRIQEIGRGKYVRRCTIQRGTVHWTNEQPYTVLSAFKFRMEKSAEVASEAYLRSQAAQVEQRTAGRVTADQWFAIKMRDGTRDLLSLDKIGRPAVSFARSLEEIEDLPNDWSEQWEKVVQKAAKRMASRPGASVDDLVNSLAIVEGTGFDTVA